MKDMKTVINFLLEKNPNYNGSKISLMTSQMFFVTFLYHLYIYNYTISFCCLIVHLISTVYHSTGIARFLDITVASSLILTFSIISYLKYNYTSIIFFMLAVSGWAFNRTLKIKDIEKSCMYHSIFVHIPSVLAIIFLK
jgi:hypothetical protein